MRRRPPGARFRMVGKRGHFRGVSFPEREDRGLARTRGRRRAFGDHLRENRALYLARAIGNRPRLALHDPELDRKSTRLNSITNAHLVCRLLLEKKKTQQHPKHYSKTR